MSIRFAILGLVAEKPLHGYAIGRAFDERVSPLWGLTTGQVYQSLTGLERAGLVASTRERTGRRPERKVYRVTQAGERALGRWLQSEPSPWSHPFREETLIRLMLLRPEDAKDLRRALRRLEDRAVRLLGEARTTHPRSSNGPALDAIFLEGLIDHLEADLKHLRRLRAEIESHAPVVGRAARTEIDPDPSPMQALPPPTF